MVPLLVTASCCTVTTYLPHKKSTEYSVSPNELGTPADNSRPIPSLGLLPGHNRFDVKTFEGSCFFMDPQPKGNPCAYQHIVWIFLVTSLTNLIRSAVLYWQHPSWPDKHVSHIMSCPVVTGVAPQVPFVVLEPCQLCTRPESRIPKKVNVSSTHSLHHDHWRTEKRVAFGRCRSTGNRKSGHDHEALWIVGTRNIPSIKHHVSSESWQRTKTRSEKKERCTESTTQEFFHSPFPCHWSSIGTYDFPVWYYPIVQTEVEDWLRGPYCKSFTKYSNPQGSKVILEAHNPLGIGNRLLSSHAIQMGLDILSG